MIRIGANMSGFHPEDESSNLSSRTNGLLTQLVESLPYKEVVIGSSPIQTTIFYASIVQR